MPEKITVLKDKILIICWASFSELLINTSKAWEHLKRLSGGRKTPIFKATILSILFVGLVRFIGVSFVETDMDLFQGIKSGITIIFSLFISVYISSFINLLTLENLTKKEAQQDLRDRVYKQMIERSKNSDYEKILYIKEK